MFAHSIKLRFQLWLAFLLVGILTGFGYTAFRLYRGSQWNQIDGELMRRLGAITLDVRRPFGLGGPGGPGEHGPGGPGGMRPWGPPPDQDFHDGPRDRHGFDQEFHGPPPMREVRLSPRTLTLFDETETNGFYFAVWNGQGTLMKQSSNAPSTLARPVKLEREMSARVETRDRVREAYQFGMLGDCILVGRPVAEVAQASRRFALWLLAAGAGVLALGLGGGWVLTTRALKPVTDISLAAERISGGNLAERISVAETDSELGQLANLLNSTFSKLEAAFAQQKQFTADAAHELRTPLAVLISETQTTLARPRSAEEYRETVEACLETAQRMRALTHSLLQLARFDAGQEPIEKSRVDLAQIADEKVEALSALAQEKCVQIKTEFSEAPFLGDAERIGQVITNLVSNAIYYNKSDGEVRVSSRVENGLALFIVADSGQGIALEHLPRIFERFYRADESRSGANGRSGLGLAISKAIVEAHGGSIEVKSVFGEGSEFVVRLPPA
jgi:two-component system OmpR family sensor kinase